MFIIFGLDRFGYKSVRVISDSDLHRVNKSSGRFGFDSGHIGFRVNSVHYSFGSVRFCVGSILNFGSKSVQLFSYRFGSDFGLFDLDRLIRITFNRSRKKGGKSVDYISFIYSVT